MKKAVVGSFVVASLFLASCSETDSSASRGSSSGSSGSEDSSGSSGSAVGSSLSIPSDATEHGRFDAGWALEFLPGTDYLLVTERGGALQMMDLNTDNTVEIANTPEVYSEGQAGMHDILAGPTFENDGTVYLSWVRDTAQGPQGVIGRGKLNTEAGSLEEFEEIWQQTPSEHDGHFALRMLIQDDYLFVTSGDRQAFDPAQDIQSNLGKVLRLTLDGEPAPGNPFAGQGGRSDEIYSMGHRNPLGIDTDQRGELWVSEMGPRGGDELNHLVEGENYGWPEASMGRHYDGSRIPDHQQGDGYVAPAEYWVPSISPGNLMIYKGQLFDEYTGNAFLGGLSGEKIVRVQLDGDQASFIEEWDMSNRIRALEEAPDGSIWILEDGENGRLLEWRPA
ncbi:PQQ-dependent sugar dehydrogenase [Corynebacterium sp. S7]